MNKQLFPNVPVPVADLPQSMAFSGRPGDSCHPQLTDDPAARVVVSETIFKS